MKMRYDRIVTSSCVDGPGQRTVLFVQGCPIQCAGCQNRHLWPEEGGQEILVTELVASLLDTVVMAQGYPEAPAITISGGEPFAQAEALAYLVACLKAYPAHVICYTGYVLEDLLVMAEAMPEIGRALAFIDVLVDGPYERALDSPWMQYRGSSNQRVIDMAATLRKDEGRRTKDEGWNLRAWRGATFPGEAPPVLLDWDTPELVIDSQGMVLGAEPVVAMFAEAGVVGPARRCGSR